MRLSSDCGITAERIEVNVGDDLIIEYVQLFGGLILLVFASDWLVDGAVDLAKRWGLPPFVVGLTIVAYGTSLPEFVVSVLASSKGVADFAVGNVVGSNIANIGLVLGTAALIHHITVSSEALYRRDIPLLGLATGVAVYAIHDGRIDRWEASTLFLIAIVFTVMSLRTPEDEGDADEDDLLPIARMLGLLIVGFAGLVYGADLMVDGGTAIALELGISERIVGLTIVAIGTSLPELAASVAAARKGHPELAIGNVVGSCLFNLAFVLGAAALINPLAVAAFDMRWDLVTMCGLTLLMFTMLRTGRTVTRLEGACLLCLYVGYITHLVLDSTIGLTL